MEAGWSRELSAHSSAMKLQQIRAARRAESCSLGRNELLAERVLVGQSECPLADGLDGWLDDMMEAGWLACTLVVWMTRGLAGWLSWPRLIVSLGVWCRRCVAGS